MSFQKSVLITASVILLVALAIIALMLNMSKSNTKYPPEIGICLIIFYLLHLMFVLIQKV